MKKIYREDIFGKVHAILLMMDFFFRYRIFVVKIGKLLIEYLWDFIY